MTSDSTFALAALTVIAGVIVFLMRSLFASKCIRINIAWGCIDIERDVDVEMSDIRQSPSRNVVGTGRSRSNTPTEVALEFQSEEE